jgi:hypothetical protein
MTCIMSDKFHETHPHRSHVMLYNTHDMIKYSFFQILDFLLNKNLRKNTESLRMFLFESCFYSNLSSCECFYSNLSSIVLSLLGSKVGIKSFRKKREPFSRNAAHLLELASDQMALTT